MSGWIIKIKDTLLVSNPASLNSTVPSAKPKSHICSSAVHRYRPFTTRNTSITPEIWICPIRADLEISPVRCKRSAVNSKQVISDLAIRHGILNLVNVEHVRVIVNLGGNAATVVLSIVWGAALVALVQLNWITSIDAATHGTLGPYWKWAVVLDISKDEIDRGNIRYEKKRGAQNFEMLVTGV